MTEIGFGIPPAPQDINSLAPYSEQEIRRVRNDLFNMKNQDTTFLGIVQFDNTSAPIVANAVDFSNTAVNCLSVDSTAVFGGVSRFVDITANTVDISWLQVDST